MKFLNRERLNSNIALCAIMISSASFYDTYLQAKAANKQVKVMTMPVIEFTHGNYDDQEKKENIYLSLHNAGSGPAILKSITFNYNGVRHTTYTSFLTACCSKEYEITTRRFQEVKNNKTLTT